LILHQKTKGGFALKIFTYVAVCAILSLAFVGCASHGTSPKGLEIPIEKAAFKFTTDVKDGGYKIVSTEELKKWLDEGKKVAIISSLPADEDKQFGTLPSAVNGAMPKTEKELTQADTDNLLKAAGSDKEKTIVVYCGFVACRRSHIGAKILFENGFQNVYRYPGGITAWQEMGFPITK
jgi:thiosulfate/3-mercaptopyruvate sulfurtransferase